MRESRCFDVFNSLLMLRSFHRLEPSHSLSLLALLVQTPIPIQSTKLSAPTYYKLAISSLMTSQVLRTDSTGGVRGLMIAILGEGSDDTEEGEPIGGEGEWRQVEHVAKVLCAVPRGMEKAVSLVLLFKSDSRLTSVFTGIPHHHHSPTYSCAIRLCHNNSPFASSASCCADSRSDLGPTKPIQPPPPISAFRLIT